MIISLIIILLSNLIAVELSSANLFENSNKVPTAKEVFSIKTDIKEEKATITWEITDGYYMYFDSIELKYKDEEFLFNVLESKKEFYKDEFFGETQILKKKFNIKADLNYILNLSDVFIYYQGCSESGFCYPLQKNKLF